MPPCLVYHTGVEKIVLLSLLTTSQDDKLEVFKGYDPSIEMSVFISDLGTSPYLSETVPSELDWTTENWPSAPGKQGTMGRLSTKNFLALRTVGIWPNNSVKIIPKT